MHMSGVFYIVIPHPTSLNIQFEGPAKVTNMLGKKKTGVWKAVYDGRMGLSDMDT